MKKLRTGYTTGVHTSFAFKSALEGFLATNTKTISKTNKMDNDDLDVTKGCEIVVTISQNIDDLELNEITHKPYILESKDSKCSIYAGLGVGVVTKDGLKPPKGYPAINPVPLDSLKRIFENFINYKIKVDLVCCVSVSDGEQLAKQTANTKVGILGGISILGTTGIVKPISATSYIDSIKEELNFALANSYDTVHFTLGNSSYKKATQDTKDGYIIEIGNFIYDGITLAVERRFENIVLWIGVAKAVKVAQGCKNTHNRFGGIDFKDISSWLGKDLDDSITIKGIRESLGDECDMFDNMIYEKTMIKLKEWFGREIEVKIIR